MLIRPGITSPPPNSVEKEVWVMSYRFVAGLTFKGFLRFILKSKAKSQSGPP
jgi:hypothetical protein